MKKLMGNPCLKKVPRVADYFKRIFETSVSAVLKV